uniref:Uncharacterized protein n=1 Tax=Rhizophora mucronata TaxID=61149 RepID=A0A2P2KDW0_RHIMU
MPLLNFCQSIHYLASPLLLDSFLENLFTISSLNQFFNCLFICFCSRHCKNTPLNNLTILLVDGLPQNLKFSHLVFQLLFQG